MTDEQNKIEEKPQESLAQIYDKIKAENDRTEKLLHEQKELAARNLLGGRSDAGSEPTPVKEETPKEYARRIELGMLKPGEK